MQKSHRKYVKQLTKRRDWLSSRSSGSDRVLSFDIVEHDALDWVLTEVIPFYEIQTAARREIDESVHAN